LSNNITLVEIAKVANVSTNTVSRALNNKPDVNPITKKKILDIAEELGYVLNFPAKSLRSRKTATIGIIVTDISNPFSSTVVKGIQDVAWNNNYNVILCDSRGRYDREIQSIRMLFQNRIDGLLLRPVEKKLLDIQMLRKQTVPFVLIEGYATSNDTDCVVSDWKLGGFLATSHLIKKGHERILYLNGPSYAANAYHRFNGYKSALRQGRIQFDKSLVKTTDGTMQHSYQLMRKILSSKLDFTAVFAFSDYLAAGCIKALKESNLEIPNDVAVVGHDDIEFAAVMDPPLTTIHIPTRQLGRKAAAILLKKIYGNYRGPHTIIVKPKLVVRKST